MSGTSMDGIDAALVDTSCHRLEYGITKPYSKDVKEKLQQLLHGESLSLAAVCELNTLIGREFAAAVQELLEAAKIPAQDVKAIGSHGQTVCHDTSGPIPYTLQLGCAHTIAALTQITTVADFRTRDLVNGGQGAPFAPLYHQELFKSCEKTQAVVNVGGIANVSFIRPSKQTQGWDIGPGNCLMDAWIEKHQDKAFDKNGFWARQGALITPLLEILLADPFFSLASPKSIGKEYFSLSWLQTYLKADYKVEDIQATLLHLTAHSIANTMSCETDLEILYLCGGGAHNGFLRDTLTQLLPGVIVTTTEEAGFSPDYLEAMMFAWLASQTINKIPVDLSAITGSKGPQILGALFF